MYTPSTPGVATISSTFLTASRVSIMTKHSTLVLTSAGSLPSPNRARTGPQLRTPSGG